jgi:hypothetical protein
MLHARCIPAEGIATVCGCTVLQCVNDEILWLQGCHVSGCQVWKSVGQRSSRGYCYFLINIKFIRYSLFTAYDQLSSKPKPFGKGVVTWRQQMLHHSISSPLRGGSEMPGTIATGSGDPGDMSRNVSHTVLLNRKLASPAQMPSSPMCSTL